MLRGYKDESVRIIGALGAMCSVVALYLVKEHYNTGPSFCDSMGGGAFSCNTVNQSEYSEFLGVPVAVFGAIWGAVLCYGAWRISLNDRVAYITTALLLWSSLGLVFIVYMVYAEIQLGAMCIFCTVIHIFSVIIFYLAVQLYKDLNARPSAGEFLYSLRHLMLAIFIVCVLPVFLFNMSSPVAPPKLEASSPSSSPAKSGGDYWTDLAQCMTEKGVVMYGSDSCGNCKRQKSIFNEAFKHIDYTNCIDRANLEKCEARNIAGYPTWILLAPDGKEEKRHAGFLTSQQLEEFSSCIITH